jgi:putative transcriptional regulator
VFWEVDGYYQVMRSSNLTNQFLIAMPGLVDPNFYHTVTYICVHNDEGAMGIVINRPLDMALGEVLEQMDMKPSDKKVELLPVYHGGPVQRDRGFVLHEPLSQWQSSVNIDNSVGVTTSRDILEAIASGGGPKESLVALGYAGWSAGQLEQEIMDNAWLSGPAESEVIFKTPCEKRWETAAALLGVDINFLSPDIGHA